MSNVTTTNKANECQVCKKKVGEIIPVEKLPGGGILFRVVHRDGSKPCEWSSYGSIDAIRGSKDDHPSLELRCPECNEFGVVKAEQDYTDTTKPDTWRYYISHPKGGLHLILPEHRDIVLKALGRYIEKPTAVAAATEIRTKRKYSKDKQIICPICGKLGTASNWIDKRRSREGSKSRERFSVIHTGEKRVAHYMNTLEQKEIVLKVLRPNSGYTKLRLELAEEKSLRKKEITSKDLMKRQLIKYMRQDIENLQRRIKELEKE